MGVAMVMLIGVSAATWLPATCTVIAAPQRVEHSCCRPSPNTGGMCAGPSFPCCRVTTAVVYTPVQPDVGAARIPAVITQHQCTAAMHALNTTAPCVYHAAHVSRVRWDTPLQRAPLSTDAKLALVSIVIVLVGAATFAGFVCACALYAASQSNAQINTP